jgi:hypothetical protein
MATFHVITRSELTIMVDNLGMTSMSKQCLCAMFLFELGFLHISKDVSYDYNNLVLNLVYQIPVTSSQGGQWVVGCSCYCIIGNSFTHNFQKTILMPRITRSMVKIVKQKCESNDTWPLSSVKPSSSNFIELFDSSSNDDLTPHYSSMILLNLIFQSSSL